MRKLQLLSSVCHSSDDCIRGFGFIRSLCGRKEMEALKTLPLENPVEGLSRAFEESLLKDRFVDLSGIENLADKYLKTFGDMRVPGALETYITGIRTLGDERVKSTLERFVRSVLLGTFDIDRYDTSKNPHLKRIQEYDQKSQSDILGRWKSLAFEASVIQIEKTSKVEIFSFEDFFKQKLGDGHGCKNHIEQLPELISFLKGDQKERREILEGLTQKLKEDQEKVKTATITERKELGQTVKIRHGQKLCMELIASPDLSKEEQIKKLKSILSAAKKYAKKL